MELNLNHPPPRVVLNEVGPRDGFQNLPWILDTETAAFFLERLGVATSVDIAAVSRLTRRLESVCDARFSGRLHRLVP